MIDSIDVDKYLFSFTDYSGKLLMENTVISNNIVTVTSGLENILILFKGSLEVSEVEIKSVRVFENAMNTSNIMTISSIFSIEC